MMLPSTSTSRSPSRSRAPVPAQSEEARLLVEAVSLLMTREREIEATMVDRFRQAELRAAEVEEHWEGIQDRLSRIELRLSALALSLVPGPADRAELSHIKQQVETLPIHVVSTPPTEHRAAPAVVTYEEPEPEPEAPPRRRTPGLLGDTPEAQLGTILIGVGVIVLVIVMVLLMRAGL